VDDDELAAEGLRQRLASEDALGELAKELLENPLVTRALTLAFEAREKAVRGREVALTALNYPLGQRHRAPHAPGPLGLAAA
jgi:hypothetical protein